MATWTVALHGDLADLERLATLEVGVTREGDSSFVFRSPNIDRLSEPRAVHRRALREVEMLKGLLRMAIGGPRAMPIKVGGIVRFDGAKAHFLIATPIAITLRLHDTPPVVTPGKMAALAGRDASIHRVLRLLGRRPTAANVYMAFEVLRRAVVGGESTIVALGWSTRKEISCFRYNVNKRRRGVAKSTSQRKRRSQPRRTPPAPMSMAEAEEYLTRLTLKWIASVDGNSMVAATSC